MGFIGSHIVEKLMLDQKNRITIVDDLSTSIVDVPQFLSQFNAHDSGRLTFVRSTVDDFFRLEVGYRKSFDEIYHLASPVGPASVMNQGGNMIREVVRDIYHIIDYCLANDTRLLDVSTSEVYGGGDVTGYCSEDTPRLFPAQLNMRMEYAIAKMAAETAIINTCRTTSLRAIIIRPFNVAGARQSAKGGFVVPRFVQQALSGKPYTVFNDGLDTRAFTHVSDIADGMILAMERGKFGEIYNLGNPDNKVTILELVEKINGALGLNNEIEFIDPVELYGHQYANAYDKFPNADKAMADLDWHPTLSIGDIVRDYRQEFESQKVAGILKDKI